MGLCKAPKGTNTKVTSAKGHFCAYPIYTRTAPSPAPVVLNLSAQQIDYIIDE